MTRRKNKSECPALDGNSTHVDSHAGEIRDELLTTASNFSTDYFSAKNRFLAAAARLRLAHHALQIHAPSPNDEPLTIDIAIAGPEKPKTALVLSSGVHGVEGLFGSAVQLAFLEQLLGGWRLRRERGRRIDSCDQSVRIRLAAAIQ